MDSDDENDSYRSNMPQIRKLSEGETWPSICYIFFRFSPFLASLARMMDETTRKMDLPRLFFLVLPSKINYPGSTDRLSV